MTIDLAFHYAAVICMALAIVTGALVANAPASFMFLWQAKWAAAALTGLAGLFLKPPGSPIGVPPAPGSNPSSQ
jgi:hypothetical protein